MLVTEQQPDTAVASNRETKDRAAATRSATTVDPTPTAAWSRRVRWIGGLIQGAFAAFWLVRGSLVIGGRASDVLGAGALLLGTALAGFRDLAGIRRQAEQAKPGEVVFSANPGVQL